MAIKLIAADMDGTLLRDDRTFDYDRFSKLLDQLDDRGIRFVAASGNQYEQLRGYFAKVNPDRLTYVSDNGALVMHENKTLAESPLTRDQMARAIAWNVENHELMENLIILSGNHGAYVSNHATPEIIKMVQMFYPEVHQVEKLLDVRDSIYRLSLVWPEDMDVHYAVKSLREIFGDELHATGSGFGSVDLLAPNVNKSTGLAELANLWDISPEEMVAFGDNANDLEMLRYVKVPYVMPNAEAFMQERIDQVAIADNNHDGVIATIERLLVAEDQNGTRD